MRARAIMLVIIQLFLAADALALDSTRSITQYAQTHYETRDGMPHGFANSIAQTADGYLWAGSEEGLSRFDGASLRIDHRRTGGFSRRQASVADRRRPGAVAGTRERRCHWSTAS